MLQLIAKAGDDRIAAYNDWMPDRAPSLVDDYDSRIARIDMTLSTQLRNYLGRDRFLQFTHEEDRAYANLRRRQLADDGIAGLHEEWLGTGNHEGPKRF